MTAEASVLDAADQLKSTAVEGFHQLAQELDGGFSELGDALRSQVKEHPLRAAFMAAGVGYVLGGGLAAPITRRLTRLALRAMILPILEEPAASLLTWVRSDLHTSPSQEDSKDASKKSKTADEPTAAKGAKSHGNQ